MRSTSIFAVILLILSSGAILLLNLTPIIQWGILIFLVFSLLCILLFQDLQLRRILISTEEVAAGKFGARVAPAKWGMASALVSAINKIAQRLESLLESQRELTRAVSHELRTPVARMRFGLEMMETAKTTEDRQQRRDRIEKDIDELDQLIDELLTYARLEDGAPPLNFREGDLIKVVSHVVDKAQKAGTGKSIKLIANSDDYSVIVEPKFIQRAAQNLIMNAVKYARERVDVQLIHDEKGYYIVVDDDGPGIPEHKRLDIFEPFARLDKSRTRETGGYGLGLAIVSRIAKWHKGAVTIADSELGGAQFVLWWPALESH